MESEHLQPHLTPGHHESRHPEPRHPEPVEEIGFLLRRAEEESIAAIRSPHPEASARHGAMAHAYSALAITMLDSSIAG